MIPQIGTNTLGLQVDERESREHSRKLPKTQIKEIQAPMSAQLPHQRSCQDVCMDPHYQKPPHYSQIHHDRPVSQPPIEINEIGPTIQQGSDTMPSTERYASHRCVTKKINTSCEHTTDSECTQFTWITEEGGTLDLERDKLLKQGSNPNHNDYVLNCIHENRPLTLNDVARPVFVNHYYAGEAFIPATSKKLIKLDECDSIDRKFSEKHVQQQGTEHANMENILKIRGSLSNKPE